MRSACVCITSPITDGKRSVQLLDKSKSTNPPVTPRNQMQYHSSLNSKAICTIPSLCLEHISSMYLSISYGYCTIVQWHMTMGYNGACIRAAFRFYPSYIHWVTSCYLSINMIFFSVQYLNSISIFLRADVFEHIKYIDVSFTIRFLWKKIRS